MDRIATATRALNLFGAGKHGFKDGNLAGGIAATDLAAEWFNGVQEELLAVIEAASIVPDAANRAQLLAALNASYRVPVGALLGFDRTTAPTGWLKANGAAISRTAYAALFAELGTRHGAGDGVSTFNLPDWRGEFMRGLDDGRGIDVGRVLGSAQSDDFKSHQHISPWSNDVGSGTSPTTSPLYAGLITANGGIAAGFRDVSAGDTAPTEDSEVAMRTTATGGTETRPRNRAALICIKY